MDEGPLPPDMRGYPDETLGPLVNDLVPEGTTYGEVLQDAEETYAPVCIFVYI